MGSSSEKILFPHEIIRPGQDKLIADLEIALKEKKILLAHAPTGLGKTAGALSVALACALENNKRIFFLTNRHTQHQIVINTLKLIKEKGANFSCADLIGKRWMCNQEIAGLFGNEFNEFCKAITEKEECEFYNRVREKKKLTVEAKKLVSDLKKQGPLHNEEVIRLSNQERMCSYEISSALAKDAQVIIGDYNYLFNPFVQKTIFARLEIELEDVILIVDEGHNLPNRVTEMLSANLSSYIIKSAIREAKKYNYKGLIVWLQELMRVLDELNDFKSQGFNKEKLVTKDDFFSKVNTAVNYDGFIEELELAAEEIRKKQRRSYLGSISIFLNSWKGEDKGFARIISEKTSKYGPTVILSYLCLDPRVVTEKVFNQIYAGIIMSGTLKPAFMYKDILGIERGIEKEYFSPFPAENKLSLIVPETSTKYDLRGEAMYKKIAEKCTELAILIPGNVAFFFPSYELRDKIASFIFSKKKFFWEKKEASKEEKEVFLTEFKAEKEKGGVLLGVAGANFAEGIDLPGDLLNGVVVVGLPLAHPDLKTKELIQYYDNKFDRGRDYGYIYPAMTKCIQSAGRCIRSETDKGVVIFLDERFTWQNYYTCLPKERLIVSKSYEKLLKDFFGSE